MTIEKIRRNLTSMFDDVSLTESMNTDNILIETRPDKITVSNIGIIVRKKRTNEIVFESKWGDRLDKYISLTYVQEMADSLYALRDILISKKERVE